MWDERKKMRNFSSIEKYVSSAALQQFDHGLMLKSFGNFFLVFLGSFFIGSGMGCLTALVSSVFFSFDQSWENYLDDQIYIHSRLSSIGNHAFCTDVL